MNKSSNSKRNEDSAQIVEEPKSHSKLKAVASAKTSEDTGHRWTFLTNHAHVLIVLHRYPAIVLREVALKVGITERAVQRIIQDLEEEGFIHREKVGRQNHYEVLTIEPLRHPIERHKTIGDLLHLVSD